MLNMLNMLTGYSIILLFPQDFQRIKDSFSL